MAASPAWKHFRQEAERKVAEQLGPQALVEPAARLDFMLATAHRFNRLKEKEKEEKEAKGKRKYSKKKSNNADTFAAVLSTIDFSFLDSDDQPGSQGSQEKEKQNSENEEGGLQKRRKTYKGIEDISNSEAEAEVDSVVSANAKADTEAADKVLDEGFQASLRHAAAFGEVIPSTTVDTWRQIRPNTHE